MRSRIGGIPAGPGILVVFGLGAPTTHPAMAQIEFDEPIVLPTVTNASSIEAADLNGDGRRDLVVAEEIESVVLFENRGGGLFVRLGTMFEPGTRPTLLRSADFNGDGHIDLIWVRSAGNNRSLQVFYNRGDGRGGHLETIALSGRAPGGIAVGDLTGNGLPDVVLVDGYLRDSPSLARIYLNLNGALVLHDSIPLRFNDSRAVALGDIDQDGDLDIAVLNASTYFNYYGYWKIYDSHVEILHNDGSGNFSPGGSAVLPFGMNGEYDPTPLALVLMDADGDGDLDFAVAGAKLRDSVPVEVVLLESRENGRRFERQPSLFVGRSWGGATIAAGDLDTDGDIDLIVRQNAYYETWSLANLGGFAFDAPTSVLTATNGATAIPAIADLNEDGQPDLVTGGRPGISVAMNVTMLTGPQLEPTALVRGQPATMTVSDAQPGERVYFLYSREGAGNSVGIRQLGGITLDLVDPIQLIGSAVADSNGVAELTITIPPNAPLTTVVMQAVIRRGPGGVDSVKTPFRTARIQP